MSNELIPGGGLQGSPLTTYAASKPSVSILDQAVENTTRRLEYLKGHEGDVGNLFKLGIFGGAAIWFAFNYKLVLDFVSTIVEIQAKIIYGGILGFGIWLLWLLFSSRKFQYTIAMMADSVIERFHKWAVARDPEGAAKFSINRLRKKIAWGLEAKAKVGKAEEALRNAAEEDRRATLEAFGQAQALSKEKANRAAGTRNARITLSDSQLDNSIALAKGQLRRRYTSFQEQAKNAGELAAKYSVITDVLDASQVELTNLEEEFVAAKRRYELNITQMQALEAASEVIASQERNTLNDAMNVLQQNADYCAGRTRVILEQLDPTVRAYHATQVAGVIADDDFFQAIVNDPQLQIKPETQQKVLEAQSAPVIVELQEFLGEGAPHAAEHVPVKSSTTPAPRGRNRLSDLMGGKR